MTTAAEARLGSGLRPLARRARARARSARARRDNLEVRQARTLARLARSGQLDVVHFDNSVAAFTAPEDTDTRPLFQMLTDEFGPERSVHAVHNGGYNPTLFSKFVRMLEGGQSKPLVILPITVRIRTLPWVEHPYYSFRRPAQFLSTVGPDTPLYRIRKGIPAPTAEDFARFYRIPFPTWAGDLTMGDYIHPLKNDSLGEVESARLLYAYHHGGEVVRGVPLDEMHETGRRLRELGLPVVTYQTPIPVEKGVELHGQPFYDLAARNLATMEDAFVSGYGEVSVNRTGLTLPTSHFIDWRDGTEHVNERGRAAIVSGLVDSARALLS